MNDFGALWSLVREEALRAVDRVGASGWWILGREVEGFERALAARFSLGHAVGCGSGLDALELALRSLELRPGDVVLTTPLSAFATTLAIVRAGGVPWFVDVDEHGLVDLDEVERALAAHEQVRFLVPVHLYGHAADLERLAALRARFDLRVVEDCAQAIGARSHGRPVGSVGQVSATSFYPTKNLGAMGDGGALVTGDPELAAAARCLRDYGQSAKYEHAELGLNSRLDELQAAVLHDAFLPRLAAWTERRGEVAGRYAAGLAGAAVQPLPAPPGSSSVWHLFPVLVDDAGAFAAHLQAHGIASGRHFPRLIPDQEALAGRRDIRSLGGLPRARRIAAHEVSLPIHPLLTDAEVDRVIAACRVYRSS
jgi:dTDP-4-amino-4,6-dideoxygalactose transaminase